MASKYRFRSCSRLTFEFHEHDAVAELGMAGDDASADDDGAAVEPKRDANAGADRKRHEQLDVAAAATEVGGFESQGEVGAFLADFGLDLDGVAIMEAAIMFGGSGSRRLWVGHVRVGPIHKRAPESAPGRRAYRVPEMIIGVEVGRG